jgi:hypothetical protein
LFSVYFVFGQVAFFIVNGGVAGDAGDLVGDGVISGLGSGVSGDGFCGGCASLIDFDFLAIFNLRFYALVKLIDTATKL